MAEPPRKARSRAREPQPEAPAQEPEGAPAPRPRGLTGLASAAGNAAFARALGPGGGILAGGEVHPAVERAIAAEGPRGRPLDPGVAAWAGDTYGDPLNDVRVHADSRADALARAVSARAFTVRRDVFFAKGEYQPHSEPGRRLLGHELAHAVQQRDAPDGGPLRVTQPGDASERDAERAARELRG